MNQLPFLKVLCFNLMVIPLTQCRPCIIQVVLNNFLDFIQFTRNIGEYSGIDLLLCKFVSIKSMFQMGVHSMKRKKSGNLVLECSVALYQNIMYGNHSTQSF